MRYFLRDFISTNQEDRKTKFIDFVKKQRDKEKKKVSLNAVKKLEENEEIVGYTKRKDKEEDDEHDVCVAPDMIFDYREKKRFYHKVVGYVPCECKGEVSGNNRYIGVIRFRFLLLLLLLLMALAPIMMLNGDKIPDSVKPWNPIIEEDKKLPEENKVERSKEIDIQCFSNWYVQAGQTKDLRISLENPKDNPCYFAFEIRLRKNNELLYKSNLLPPGKEIKLIDIARPLEKGKHKAYVHVITQELNTGKFMNDAIFDIEIEAQ